MTTFQQRLPAGRAGVVGGLEQRAVDAHHGVEDRHDHEQRVQVHEGEHHREVGEQQPLERRCRSAPTPISAWLTSPLRPSSGTHEIMRITFEVQNGIVQSDEQRRLHGDRAHVEGQEIGDREAEHQGDGPDDQAEFQGRQ